MKKRRIPAAMWRDAVRFIFEGRYIVDVDGYALRGEPRPPDATRFLVLNYFDPSARYFQGLARQAEELGWGRVRRRENGNLNIDLLGPRLEREIAREREESAATEATGE